MLIGNTSTMLGKIVINLGQGSSYERPAQACLLDYQALLADKRVLFLGEEHSNISITPHLVSSAPLFKAAGITHYFIEAPTTGKATFEKLNCGEKVDLSALDCGPGRDYQDACYAMIRQGILVYPIDIDQTHRPSREEREAHMAQEMRDILARDSSAKALVRIGRFHAGKYAGLVEKVATLRTRIEASGIPVSVAALTGGTSTGPKSLLNAASAAGLSQTLFVVDLRLFSNKDVLFGAGEMDYAIHLPQIESLPLISNPFH